MKLSFHINYKSQTIKHVITYPFLLIICSTCILQNATAQQKQQPDSFDITSLTKSIINHYQSNFHKTSKFYNGVEYIRPLPGTKGHPFLDADTLQKGNVYFDGTLYQDVMIAYDIVTDVLITNGYQNINLVPVPQKIEYFTLNERLFLPISDSLADKNGIRGYFEVLYQNDFTVLVHHKKIAIRAFKAEDPNSFKNIITYYLQQEQKLTLLDTEKKLLNLFDDKKEAVKAFLRRNDFNFKNMPGLTIIKSIQYYQSII